MPATEQGPPPTPQPTDAERLDQALDPEYTAISPLAVLGLVISLFGLWAPAALATGRLAPPADRIDLAIRLAVVVAVPLVGFVASAVGLAKIRRSEGVLTGEGFARAGLVLGAALAALSALFLTVRYVGVQSRLNDLRDRAYAVTDELLEEDYGALFERMPPELQDRVKAPESLRRAFSPAFRGAGAVRKRELMALRLFEDEERGALVAPAEMRIELERRILRLRILFEQLPEGEWALRGLRPEYTFESMTRFGPPQETPSPPPPAPPPEPMPEDGAEPELEG